ncbi:MAG TPA: aminotransferase class I/II-fold pyridoxal phosphate-dependent enzyme [Thermoanaerobaculia bacterium]
MQDNLSFSRRTFARAIGAGAILAAVPKLTLAKTPPLSEVRLSANENPYGPSPAAMRAMTEALRAAPRYPDGQDDDLASDIARRHGVNQNQVILGDGSSDILRLAAAAFSGPGKRLITADPTFESIGMHGVNYGAEVVKVPLTVTHAHDLQKMQNGALVYICNPNNPTATITPKAALRSYIEALPRSTAVVVDEAYFHYATSPDYESVIPLVAAHPNLIVARTFSKIYAMAGIRAGYAIAQADTIDKLRAQQQWDVMNVVALAGAKASIADADHVTLARKRNSDTKAWLAAELQKNQYQLLPSETNFVMIDVRRNVKPLIAQMRGEGVQVGRLFPAMPHHLRVTIGTPEEMERFVGAFRRISS